MALYAALMRAELGFGEAGHIRGTPMIDLIFIATAIAFFLVAIAYTHGCEKLRGGSHD